MNELSTPKTITKAALKLSKREFAVRFFVAFVSRALLLLIPVLFSFAIDSISKGDFNRAYMMAVILIIVFILFRLTDIANTYTWHKLYNKLYQSYTNVGLHKTHDNSLFSLSRINVGEYINIMNNDINVMCDFYCNLPIRIIRVFEFLFILSYFFFINLLIGFTGIVVSVIAFLILFLSRKKIQVLNQKRAYELDRRTSILHEILLCIKEIKGFNIFKPMNSRAIKASDDYVDALLTQRVIEDIYRFGIVLLIEIFRLGLFIYGIYLITQGKMELGVLLVIYNYYAQLIDNFSDFATINVSYRNLKVSENRFNKILEYSKNTKNSKKLRLECTGDISFKDVLYGYKDAPTLNNVSFDINANELTCIVGDTASGKSGIIDLLLKLNRQHSGSITIDDTDINDFNSNEYFDLIALTSDESSFFNVSIKENLNMIDNDFEKIVDVCKSLDIHEYITSLKDGYDTVLAFNGDNIDFNAKILLGVARVLLRHPRILIFDEIFTLLNRKQIDNIMNILNGIKDHHTVIIFSKEEHILKEADSIILINNHEVKEIGRHDELINSDKLYQELVTK